MNYSINSTLDSETVSHLSREIEIHNSNHKAKPISKLNVNAGIDTINMRQLPFIGRAIGIANGTEYLDKGNRYPLSIDDNAMRYAMEHLDRFFSSRKDQSII